MSTVGLIINYASIVTALLVFAVWSAIIIIKDRKND